jgi:site-specific recombinase XerD
MKHLRRAGGHHPGPRGHARPLRRSHAGTASKRPPIVTLEQASLRCVLDAQARNLTEDRIRFVEQVHRRYIDFLHERHPELGDHPPVTALTIDSARDFTAWLKTHTGRNPFSGEPVPKGSTTIRAHLVDLKAFSRFCSDEGLLPDHPLAKLRMPKVETKVIETFKSHHLEAMLKLVDGQLQRDRNRAVIYLLLSTGMRASELCMVRRKDVDLRSRSVRVMGKGRTERIIRFDATTGKLLAKYMSTREDDPEAPVFISRYGKPLNRLALYRVIDKLGTEAGITDVRVSPHTFRHSFATQFLRAHPGAIFHLMELLGHTNPMMTRRYARLAEAEANLEGPGPVEILGLDQLAKRR